MVIALLRINKQQQFYCTTIVLLVVINKEVEGYKLRKGMQRMDPAGRGECVVVAVG